MKPIDLNFGTLLLIMSAKGKHSLTKYNVKRAITITLYSFRVIWDDRNIPFKRKGIYSYYRAVRTDSALFAILALLSLFYC